MQRKSIRMERRSFSSASAISSHRSHRAKVEETRDFSSRQDHLAKMRTELPWNCISSCHLEIKLTTSWTLCGPVWERAQRTGNCNSIRQLRDRALRQRRRTYRSPHQLDGRRPHARHWSAFADVNRMIWGAYTRCMYQFCMAVPCLA